MGLTTKQVIERYNLQKTVVDHLIRKWGKKWGLEKDPAGFWVWPPAAIKALDAHLARRPAMVEQVPAGLPANLPAEEKSVILAFAEGIGKRLDSIQAAMITKEQLVEILAHQSENYNKEIHSLQMELASIKKALPPEHGERRHPPEGFFDLIYRYFCLAPAVERRR